MRRIPHLFLALLLGASLAPAHAWKGDAGAKVHPIAEVDAKAEKGDVVTVEGEITDVRSGPGSLRMAIVEDATGEVVVAVAEHLRRGIERTPGEDPIGARVRVTGTWEHGYLEQDRRGIRVTSVEVLSRP
jgi:RecJ-like exonuclease